MCGSLAARAQDILTVRLDGSEQGKSLPSFLGDIEKKTRARFYFLSEWLEPISFTGSYHGKTLADALDELLQGTGISFISLYPDAVVFIKDPTGARLRQQYLEAAVREEKKIERYQFGTIGHSKKGRVVISGRVTDATTGEPMAHANIQVSDSRYSTATGETGGYSLSLPSGVYVLDVSFVDYEARVIDLSAYDDGEINLELEEMPTLLGEVVIRDQPAAELATSRIGQARILMREIKRAPALLGEPDVIKQVQTLPGVTTVGESASGFNVRGGSVDQNLVLYDGLPVFNSSHVFGFLSAFNSQAIGDVSFYRGGIPSEYGGRASSVLDIRSLDGDFHKWNGDAGVGMITSNVSVNGPLRKDKTSLAVSLRSTYSNWLVHSIRTDYADLGNSAVFFYDGTAKLTHVLNDRTRVSVTAYSSKDSFRLLGDSTYQWSNMLVSARLDHEFSERLRAEIVAGTSVYGYRILNKTYSTASTLSYGIAATGIKAAFNYQERNHKLSFGWQELLYRFHPGTLSPASPVSNARRISLDKQNSMENALYFSDEWNSSGRLSVEAGLRIPMFVSFGPARVNTYGSGGPPADSNVTDSLYYRWDEPVKTYGGLEPRLSLRWLAGASASFKLGYNRMYQFLHLVTNTAAVTPEDIWQPSGYYFKPQRADEVSLGYFKDLNEKKAGFSAEVFYKHMEHILDFRDGARLILNPHLETALLQGRGRAYGVETSFSKNTGRLTGSLNYTWSRSFRTVGGYATAESINGGNEYPSNFDQPHVVNLSWKYNLSRRYLFTGGFTYHTGRPITIPLSALTFENMTIAYFSGRNQYRIPDYHRLDLALVIEGNNRRSKKAEGTWVISAYNVYARRNPYSIFFKSAASGTLKPYQLSIIGTVLPSISYNLKFR